MRAKGKEQRIKNKEQRVFELRLDREGIYEHYFIIIVWSCCARVNNPFASIFYKHPAEAAKHQGCLVDD